MSRLKMLVVSTVTVVAVLGITLVERTELGRRLSRRAARRITRLARYETGRLEGLRYHLAGRGPDPAVTDRLLADRVRSTIGPLEHRLDIPRVHISACGHVVTLHGEVDSARHVQQVVEAVAKVPGVARVDSRLRVVPVRAENRPSQAGAHRRAS